MPLGVYTGPERLVFAIDVGTTMSAVSFAHLVNGEEIRIRLVTRWPGQEDATGDCKIPSVLRYNQRGIVTRIGAEAVDESLENEDLVRWFKLHLHPASMKTANNLTPPPLPSGVGLKTVYADILGYLFRHARNYLEMTTLDPVSRGSLFERFKSSFDLCLAIPNGWADAEQGFLRDAVVSAGVLPANYEQKRIQFVSESEAAVHFALAYASIGNWLRVGTILAVCDAGGSTVDTTLYQCTQVTPTPRLEEVTSSECVQAGSAFLDQGAGQLLSSKLSGSRYNNLQMVRVMIRDFERKTKRKFDGSNDDSVIHFGHMFDEDPEHGIMMGRIILTSDEVKNIFAEPINSIARSIGNLFARAGRPCEAFVLVGGFAESTYLQKVLQERLQGHMIRHIRIDEATKKAAAEGAVAWCAKQFVVARAARATYGISIERKYQAKIPEHKARRKVAYSGVDGNLRLSGFFGPLVKKNAVIQADQCTRSPFFRSFPAVDDNKPTSVNAFEIDLLCTEQATPDLWCKGRDGSLVPGMRRACTLRADLSGLLHTLQPVKASKKRKCWRIDFEIEIFFGQTSLCAAIVWNERGMVKRGPVSVIPNSIA